MKDKVLIIHHFEPCWEDGYRKRGTSFEELQKKFINHLSRAKYKKVILTRFDDDKMNGDYLPEFAQKIHEVKNYGYGWEKAEAQDEIENCASKPEDWTGGGIHSEVVWLAPFIKELKDKNVIISGVFDGECLEDLEIALKACGVKYKRNETLIL